MAVKSVLDVEVNDATFRRFQESFDKYQKALARQPAAWRGTTAAAQQQRTMFEGMLASMFGIQELATKVARRHDETSKHSERTKRNWEGIAKSARDWTHSVERGVRSILRITAIGGLIGAGGLFGLDVLARRTAAGRRSSTGVGATLGEQRAFRLNYGRLVDPDAFLSAVGEARSDVTQRFAFRAAGLTESEMAGKDTAQLSALLLPKLKEIADRTPDAQLANVMRARGLDRFVSVEDMRRLRAATPEDMAKYATQYQKDVRGLGVEDEVAKKWQDLSIQLSRAGEKIETVLIKALGNLAGPIEHLSDSFTKAIEAFGNSPAVKHWIDLAAEGFESLAKYIGTPAFQSDVEAFAAALGRMVSAVGDAVRWFEERFGGEAPARVPEPPDDRSTWERFTDPRPDPRISGNEARREWNRAHGRPENEGLRLDSLNNPGNLRDPKTGAFRRFGSEGEGLRAMRDQLLRDEYVHGQDTIRKIVGGNERHGGYTSTDVDSYIKGVSSRTGFGADEHLDLGDRETMAKLMAAMTKQENARSTYTPKTVVEVMNNTGGNAIVSASQVAQ